MSKELVYSDAIKLRRKETITQCNGCNLIGFCMYNRIYGEVGKKERADTSSLSFVPWFKN